MKKIKGLQTQSSPLSTLPASYNLIIDGKNDFAESKNLGRYRSENNFVGPSK